MRPSAGQLQQMNWEQEAAKQLELDWHSRMYCPEAACEKSAVTVFDEQIEIEHSAYFPHLLHILRSFALFKWLLLRRNYHRWLSSQLVNYDLVIMRYYVHDPFQWLFLRSYGKQVLFYSHTLEVPELKMGGNITAKVRASLEAWIGPKSLSYAAGILGVTSEVVDYQLSRIQPTKRFTYEYPNGVMNIPDVLVDERSEVTPEFLFVANFLPWHGLDNLVGSVKSSTDNMVLHIVGGVSNEIKSQVAGESRIVLHGQLSFSQILELSRRCWVGVSSLRLDRKGAKKAATLKAPMYLSLGLPVYGCGDVLPESLDHYQQGGPDINMLLDFARRSRIFEKSKIQEDALPFIDKRLLLNNLVKGIAHYFESVRG